MRVVLLVIAAVALSACDLLLVGAPCVEDKNCPAATVCADGVCVAPDAAPNDRAANDSVTPGGEGEGEGALVGGEGEGEGEGVAADGEGEGDAGGEGEGEANDGGEGDDEHD